MSMAIIIISTWRFMGNLGLEANRIDCHTVFLLQFVVSFPCWAFDSREQIFGYEIYCGIKLDMFYIPNFGQVWSFKKLSLKISKLESGSIDTLVIWLILNSNKRSKKWLIFWSGVCPISEEIRIENGWDVFKSHGPAK